MRRSPGPFAQLYYKWKSLKLPWRRQVLCGVDLSGNTFWEFKDANESLRVRRIVRYSQKTHYGDVKITPQWHQWLRHTRQEPPTLQEQQGDLYRQAQMRQLAAAADARWDSRPSFLDAPNMQQPKPAIGVNDPGGYVQQTEPTANEGVRSAVGSPDEVDASVQGKPKDEGRFKGRTKEREPSPFARPAQGSPGEEWQPQAWTPTSGPRR